MPGMGSDRVWNGVNIAQKSFLAEFFGGLRQVLDKIKEITGIASWDAAVINRFLSDHGFSITLEPFDDQTFGVASVLDLMVEWVTEGIRTTIRSSRLAQEYPAVRLTDGVNFARADSHPHPIAAVSTKSGDLVMMTKLDQMPPGEFGLVDLAGALTKEGEYVYDEFGGLVFPMVDLNQEVDLSWLLGLWTVGDDGKRATITQAKQQNKLRMNEKGARAQSAAAVAVTRECISIPKPDMVIDGPFLVWFVRLELGDPQRYIPLFVALVTEADWCDPGDISVA